METILLIIYLLSIPCFLISCISNSSGDVSNTMGKDDYIAIGIFISLMPILNTISSIGVIIERCKK